MNVTVKRFNIVSTLTLLVKFPWVSWKKMHPFISAHASSGLYFHGATSTGLFKNIKYKQPYVHVFYVWNYVK